MAFSKQKKFLKHRKTLERLKFTVKRFFVEVLFRRDFTLRLVVKTLVLKCLQAKLIRDNNVQVCFSNTGSSIFIKTGKKQVIQQSMFVYYWATVQAAKRMFH